jgi:biotin carboxyl carrier protein
MRNAPRSCRGAFSKGALLLIAFAAACVLVPGLFWWGTTFTRELDDSQLVEQLRDGATPREVQHAVEELSRRFQEGRPGMERWAEDLVRVSAHPEEAVRISAAWCMQFDATRDAFRERLRELTAADPSPMVRRNAATSLAKSADPAALPILRAMLEPFTVTAPAAGVLQDLAGLDQPVEQGAQIGQIDAGGEELVDVRAAVPGSISEVIAKDGATVTAGAALVRIRPAAEHLKNAMLGLAIVGTTEDADRARSAADSRSGYPDDVRAAAEWAARQIDARDSGE